MSNSKPEHFEVGDRVRVELPNGQGWMEDRVEAVYEDEIMVVDHGHYTKYARNRVSKIDE